MTRFSRPTVTESRKGSAFVIFKFDYDILRHLPPQHLLQQRSKIVYYLSERMKTVADVINGLRAKFAIPVQIEMLVHGGCYLLPDLPAKALTHFSNSVRVQLQLGETTTGRNSSNGAALLALMPPPTPECSNDEEQESIETNEDPASDSGMSESESDKEDDKEQEKLRRKVSTPGPRKVTFFAERARQVEGSAQVRTRWNSLTDTTTRGLLQISGMNSSDTPEIQNSLGSSAGKARGHRRLKRSAQGPYPSATKRKLSFNVTEDQTDSIGKDAEEIAEHVILNIENAIQTKLASSKPERLNLSDSVLRRQIDRTPRQLTPWPQDPSRSASCGRFQYLKQWSQAKYEDVKPHQIVQLKVKKRDDWKDVMNVVITVVEIQQDCIKGKRVTPTTTSGEIEVFSRFLIKEIKIWTVGGEVVQATTV